jgi:hypothetical protein
MSVDCETGGDGCCGRYKCVAMTYMSKYSNSMKTVKKAFDVAMYPLDVIEMWMYDLNEDVATFDIKDMNGWTIDRWYYEFLDQMPVDDDEEFSDDVTRNQWVKVIPINLTKKEPEKERPLDDSLPEKKRPVDDSLPEKADKRPRVEGDV